MPNPTLVKITYNGVTDITKDVIWQSATFEMSANAGVGSFAITIRDKERTRSYVTGATIELLIGGTAKVFGGFITQISQTFAFPVVSTANVSTVTQRLITLRGVSYNVLFDRLVAHNDANPIERLPIESTGVLAGPMVSKLMDNYIDAPAGFGHSFVDDVGLATLPGQEFAWVDGGRQGVTWREELQFSTLYNSAVFYFDADKQLHYHAPESLIAEWGFSDRPNYLPIAGRGSLPVSFNGAFYGFREMEASEDISNTANDVFIWGGTGSFANPSGAIVFARYPDAPYDSTEQLIANSQTLHGRWQYAETHFNETTGGLGTQPGVDARARAIAAGPPGGSATGIRGRGQPDLTLSLSWFAHDVPRGTSTTSVQHLSVGQIVVSALYVHGQGGVPLILSLPLRSLSIRFPSSTDFHGTGGEFNINNIYAFVEFTGQFGISIDDPFGLWTAIRGLNRSVSQSVATIGSATPDSGSTSIGAVWQGEMSPAPNGSAKTFFVTVGGTPAPYLASTSEIYLNGLRQSPGADYLENNAAGSITFFTAPSSGVRLYGVVRLAG